MITLTCHKCGKNGSVLEEMESSCWNCGKVFTQFQVKLETFMRQELGLDARYIIPRWELEEFLTK